MKQATKQVTKQNILVVGARETGGGKVQSEILLKKLRERDYNTIKLSMVREKVRAEAQANNEKTDNKNETKHYAIGEFAKNRRGPLRFLDVLKYVTIEIFNPLVFFFTIYLIVRNKIKTVIILTYNQISLSPLIASKLLMRRVIVTMHTHELLCSYSTIMPFCYGVKGGMCGICMSRYHRLPKNFKKLKPALIVFYNSIASFVVFLKLQLTNHLADKIIFPSDHSKRIHVYYGVKKEKAKVISCFFDSPESKDANAGEFVRNKPKGKKVILYVGRIEEEKGIEVLLKSLREVLKTNKRWELFVIGRGRSFKRMKNLARVLKIDKHVKFLGSVSHSDVFSYYAISDIVVIPSIAPETFSIVLTEASISKKIIICSKIGALEDRVRDGETGFLVEPNNPEELAKKIVYVLDNFRKLKHLGENAYIDAKRKYDSGQSFSQYLRIIEG